MIQRDWEDALFAAEAAGQISDRALLLGLRLSRVITWDTPRPGVYWQGESLYETLRLTKTTYYRLRGDLLVAGLVADDRGNLVPTSPIHETASPVGGTESPTGGTESPTGETHMHAVANAAASADQPRAISLSAETSPDEIAAAFPGPENFPKRAAATFVMASYQRWPEATRPRFTTLVRVFEQARQHHPDPVLWQGMLQWIGENEGSTTMRSPAAVFVRHAADIFDETAADIREAAKEETP